MTWSYTYLLKFIGAIRNKKRKTKLRTEKREKFKSKQIKQKKAFLNNRNAMILFKFEFEA